MEGWREGGCLEGRRVHHWRDHVIHTRFFRRKAGWVLRSWGLAFGVSFNYIRWYHGIK